MIINIMLKTVSRAEKCVKAHLFYLEKNPATVKELISETVKTCLSIRKSKLENKSLQAPINEEQLDEMEAVGKYAFNELYNDNMPDTDTAVNIALDAYRDGLVRIFKNENELTEINDSLSIKEGDEITFIRLSFLSGRIW